MTLNFKVSYEKSTTQWIVLLVISSLRLSRQCTEIPSACWLASNQAAVSLAGDRSETVGSHYDVLSGAMVQIMRRCCCEGLLSTLPCSESWAMMPSITFRPSSM